MDFVVVGLGLGTVAILTGLSLLTWVAGRWERASARGASPQHAAYDAATAASRRSTGQAIIAAGVGVVIATILALAGSLDDQIGAFFVATTVTVAAIGLLVWGYLHRMRHPLPKRHLLAEPVVSPEPASSGGRTPRPALAVAVRQSSVRPFEGPGAGLEALTAGEVAPPDPVPSGALPPQFVEQPADNRERAAPASAAAANGTVPHVDTEDEAALSRPQVSLDSERELSSGTPAPTATSSNGKSAPDPRAIDESILDRDRGS